MVALCNSPAHCKKKHNTLELPLGFPPNGYAGWNRTNDSPGCYENNCGKIANLFMQDTIIFDIVVLEVGGR